MTQDVVYGAALQRAAVVAELIQGEVLGIADACVVVGDAGAPMSREVALAAADSGVTEGLVVAPHVVDDVVLLTQTCDLQETTPDDYVCLVAPVRQAPPNWRGKRNAVVAPGSWACRGGAMVPLPTFP